MRIVLDIPEEFRADFEDRFADFFGRVKEDIDYNGLCGRYEKETAEMFEKAFRDASVVG